MIGHLQSALHGIRSNYARFDRAASRIARNSSSKNISRNFMEMTQAKHGVKANAKALKIARNMEGSLLDILA